MSDEQPAKPQKMTEVTNDLQQKLTLDEKPKKAKKTNAGATSLEVRQVPQKINIKVITTRRILETSSRLV
jgi:hypothetical protein